MKPCIEWGSFEMISRIHRSLGPVLYQQLWCSSSSHCEQENWWRQTHCLAYVLCLIKKWRWPIKIVLAYTFFKTWYRYQENKAERNASIIANGTFWSLPLKKKWFSWWYSISPKQPWQEDWQINRKNPSYSRSSKKKIIFMVIHDLTMPQTCNIKLLHGLCKHLLLLMKGDILSSITNLVCSCFSSSVNVFSRP